MDKKSANLLKRLEYFKWEKGRNEYYRRKENEKQERIKKKRESQKGFKYISTYMFIRRAYLDYYGEDYDFDAFHMVEESENMFVYTLPGDTEYDMRIVIVDKYDMDIVGIMKSLKIKFDPYHEVLYYEDTKRIIWRYDDFIEGKYD